MKTTIALVGLLTVLGVQETQAGDGFSLLRVSTPLVISGSAGFRAGDDAFAMRPSLQVETGIGGGRLAIGLDNTGKPGLGFGLKAAFLRTWLFPVEVDEDQMFWGSRGKSASRIWSSASGGTGAPEMAKTIGWPPPGLVLYSERTTVIPAPKLAAGLRVQSVEW